MLPSLLFILQRFQGLFQSQHGRTGLGGANVAEEKLLSGLQAQQLKEFQLPTTVCTVCEVAFRVGGGGGTAVKRFLDELPEDEALKFRRNS